MEIDEDRPMI